MKVRLPKSRILRALIYWLCISLVLIAADLVLVQVRRSVTPGYETTRITQPRTEDGRIDYFRGCDDYFSRGVKSENNAAILLLRAFGRGMIPNYQPPDGLTDKLGMEHLPEKGDYFTPKDDFSKTHQGQKWDDVEEELAKNKWPLTFTDEERQWVDANSKPLALVQEASKKEKYFIPFDGGGRPDTMVSVLLPQVHYLMDSGRALTDRAAMRLEKGDVAGFDEDVLAALRLSSLMSHVSTAVERLVGAKISQMVVNLVSAEAAHGKLSAEQAKALLEQVNRVPAFSTSFNFVDSCERYICLDMMQWCAQGGPTRMADLLGAISGSNYGWFHHFGFSFLPVPFEQSMRNLNHFFDGAIVASQLPTYRMRIEAMKRWEQEVKDTAGGPGLLVIFSSNFGVRLLMPAMEKEISAFQQVQVERAMMKVALALAIYHGEHGNYPQALAELAQKNLPEMPQDSFADAPFIYARDAGGFELRSVGPDMKQGTSDDIIVTSR